MIIALLILNLISKYFCDLVKFKPHLFENGKEDNWYLAKGKYSWDKRSMLTKGIFSFASDLWHASDSTRNMSFIIVVVIALGLQWYWCIVGYALYGGAFNLIYKMK